MKRTEVILVVSTFTGDGNSRRKMLRVQGHNISSALCKFDKIGYSRGHSALFTVLIEQVKVRGCGVIIPVTSQCFVYN